MAAADYDALPRTPANHQPLTPLLFLERAAHGLPGPHRRRAWRAAPRPTANCATAACGSPMRWRSAASGAATRWRRCCRTSPEMLECHYGVPMAGGVLNTINTRLDAGDHRLYPRPRRGEGGHRGPRIGAAAARRAGAMRGEAAADRGGRPAKPPAPRAPTAWAAHGLRGAAGRGRSALRLADARRRMGRHRAQLHLRHHRQAEGRGLPPSRRAAARHRQRAVAPAWAGIPSISGRCRCSTATAGASPGPSPRMAGTHVCLRAVRGADHVVADGRAKA